MIVCRKCRKVLSLQGGYEHSPDNVICKDCATLLNGPDMVCGKCRHYIGGGDFSLCCDISSGLVYVDTKACDQYDEEPRCGTCRFMLRLEKLDYSGKGCQHTDMDGFVCMAFADEGVANWMVGLSDGRCECYEKREGKT